MPALRLIVGLGSPGNEYLNTRHNVGAEWLDGLATSYDAQFKENSKLEGWCAKAMIEGTECLLLKPMTYMNESGLSVRLTAGYFQIPINAILVVSTTPSDFPSVSANPCRDIGRRCYESTQT